MKKLAIIALLLFATQGYAADCTSTKPDKGVSCTDADSGLTVTRVTNYATDAASLNWMRHEYSKRQAFNADSTRFLTWASNGTWHLYNASTYARIKQLIGPAGDAEPTWHPTDATKFWYLPNNGGTVVYSYDTDDDSTVTAANFAGRLPWSGVTYISTAAEGSPSVDGRYWAFMARNASFSMLGIFTYDMQTDTILATKTVSETPNYITATPSGDYVVVAWFSSQLVDGVAGRTRAYTRDLTDWTYVDCDIEHSDVAIGVNGADYYVGVDYTNGGTPACSPANGYVFMRDIAAGWVSQGYNTSRTDLFGTYINGSVQAVHISGRATSRTGGVIVSTYNCDAAPCPSAQSNRVMWIPMVSSPTIQYLTSTHDKYGGIYFAEPQATINKAGTRAMFASNWDMGGTADENVDSYIVELPAAAFAIITTTLPNGTNGQAYQADAQTSGGTQPPTACITSAGAVPSGATWSVVGNACRLSDASAETGTYNFTLQATDSNSNTDTQAFTLTINAALQIDTASPMPDGTIGGGYSEQLVCSGGTPPRTFSCCQAGSLPNGLSQASDGTFTGTFQQTGTFNFTARCTDNVAATADKALQITVGSGVTLTMRQPTIYAGDTYATFRLGATGLDFASDCTAIVKDSGGATVDTVTSTSGPAIRTLVTSALTASSTYSATFTCDGAQPDVTPYPFVTQATPAVGDRTVPIQFGTPPAILVGAARVTVEYDDNAALSTPATVQNTSCGSGCTVSLTIPAGLYYYRWKWQTAADAVLATSTIQALPVP